MYQNQENSTIVKGKTWYVVILLLFILTALPQAMAQQDPCIPGIVEGIGTYFEITDSEYLNITLTSTEPVQLSLESISQMVLMEIEAAEGTTPVFTQITLTGFIPLTTYYQYQDDYHNGTAITTDADGSYAYQQDLTLPHLVFIQPQPSTIFIPTDTSVGTWDPVNRIYNLNTNVYESIQIDENNLTLRGNGFTINGDNTGFGIYLNGRTGVTLENLSVREFSRGINIQYSSGNTLTGNTFNSNIFGIFLNGSSNNTLVDNIMSNNQFNLTVWGTVDSHFDNNINTSNTVDGKLVYYVMNAVDQVFDNSTIPNAGVLYCVNGNNLTIRDFTLMNNRAGVFLWNTHYSTIENINTLNNWHGIILWNSSNNTLIGNTADTNISSGIHLTDSHHNNLTSNISTSNFRGIYLHKSGNSTLRDNTMSENHWNFYVGGSVDFHFDNDIDTSNTVDEKLIYYVKNAVGQVYDTTTISNVGDLYLINCDDITVKDLILSNNHYGVFLWNVHNSTIENTTASNNISGICLMNSGNNMLTGNNASYNIGSDGIRLWYSSNNILTENTSNNNQRGIFIWQSHNNSLTDNSSNMNHTGIYLGYASNNTLMGNTANSNKGFGIYILNYSGNQIYNNNFIDNATQTHVHIGSGNVFNLDPPIGGNYWSDWTSPDADGDGFVDIPYVFTGGQDDLPLVQPFEIGPYGPTPFGDNVFSDLVDPETGESLATLTFNNVTEAGVSTLTTTTPAEYQGPPEGFKVGQPPTIFNIDTTAVYEGPIDISINYSGISFQNESTLKLFHFENDDWVDVTTSVDTDNDIIYGEITSFSAFAIFELDNQPPEVTITGPASGFVCPVNVPVDFTADIYDPDINDTHSALWTLISENMTGVFDGTVDGSIVSDAFTFIEAGIYSIELMVTDADGQMDVANTVNDDADFPAFIVVYDPDGGFVTGGGWIYSPAGALLDSTAEGKANFGFVSKYKHGKIFPEGNTEFRFNAGDFRFKSSSYEWLVVAGTKAMFKGEGLITGMDGAFKFMLTAVDSDEDKFRIKIWDPLTDEVIYDNKRGQDDDAEPTTIGGGSIVIHKN